MESTFIKLLTTDLPSAAPGDEHYTFGDHPAIHELAAYAAHKSEGIDRAAIKSHLSKCPRCARGVERLAGVADDVESILENMTENDLELAAKKPTSSPSRPRFPGFDATTKRECPFVVTFDSEPTLTGNEIKWHHAKVSADETGHNSRGVLIRLFGVGEEREFLTEATPIELGVWGDITFTLLYPEAACPILERHFGIFITCSIDADPVS